MAVYAAMQDGVAVVVRSHRGHVASTDRIHVPSDGLQRIALVARHGESLFDLERACQHAAVPRRRLILIPPSQAKAPGGNGAPLSASPEARDHPLAPLRHQVVAAVGERGIDRAPTMAAIDRYTGVLYQHLDAPALDAQSTARLHRCVRIVSGMWGVLSPGEAIPEYRLKMSASLPGLGRLSTWWRPAVSEFLAADIRTAELWNLLPQEHAAAFVAPPAATEITVRFLRHTPEGEAVAVSHWNKALKGALVSHLLSNPTATLDDLTGWDHPAGYRLDPSSLDPDGGVMALRFVASTG